MVVGGGMSGAETADFLGEHNRQVTIVEMLPSVAADEQATVRFFLMKRLEEHKANGYQRELFASMMMALTWNKTVKPKPCVVSTQSF